MNNKSLNLPSIEVRNNNLSKRMEQRPSVPKLDLSNKVKVNSLMKNEKENLNELFQNKKKGSLDLVLMGDLTGSMSAYHNLLKVEFLKLSSELFQMIPDLQIGIIFYLDHGSGDPYITKTHPISSDTSSLHSFIKTTPTGYGGEEKEAVEDALYEALNLNWRPKVNRSIVIFGDAAGKEVEECPYQHSYFEIVKNLYEKQVTINSVFCRRGFSAQNLENLVKIEIGDFNERFRTPGHPHFFSWLSNVTGGLIIGIDEISDLLEIIKASAAKDAGVLEEYETSISKSTSKKKLELIEISKRANQRKLEKNKFLMLEG